MSDQKTEQPTAQRRRKAREEGRFPSSRDLLAAVQLLVALGVGLSLGSHLWTALETMTVQLFRRALSPRELTLQEIPALAQSSLQPALLDLFKMSGLVMGAVLLLQLLTTGFGISLHPLMPDLGRLNPSSRLKGMFSQNASSTLKALLILPMVAIIVYAVIAPQMSSIANLSAVGLGSGLAQSGQIMETLLWRVLGMLLLFGLVDFVRQRQKFQKELRMTKQEIKDEVKENDGNLQMKMQIRRLQRETIRKNMIKAIPQASVVIVNPTHYAIAVKYEMASKSVPTVLAKGKNELALLIRERARQHEVPIVENKPLARALYDAVEIGQEIPPHLYRAVAEVLAHIYQTVYSRNRKP